jgi:predicted Zn-dependent protease
MMLQNRFVAFLLSAAAAISCAFPGQTCAEAQAGKGAPGKQAAPEVTGELDAALAAEFAAADKRPEDAARLYIAAAKAQKRADFAERAARLALSARNFGLAQEAADTWLDISPKNLNALQAQAFTLIVQGKKAEALVKLRALLLIDSPESAGLALNLVAAPDARGLAVELLEALKTEPKLLALPIERGLVPLSLRLKQNDLALALSQVQVKAEPKNAKAWLWQGLAEIALERQDEAAKSYAMALSLDPKNVRLRLSYVQLLNQQKRFDDIDTVLKDAPEASDEIFQARIALILAQRDLKPAAVNRALKRLAKEIEHSNGLGLSNRQMLQGQIFELTMQPKTALEWYRAVSKGDAWPGAQLRIAIIQSEQDLKAARQTLDGLQNSDAPEQAISDAYLLESELLAKATELEAARATLTEAVDRMPENTALLYARAMNAFAQNDIDGLESDLKLVIEIDPENAQALNALGFSLLDKTARVEEATNYIQQAYLLDPKSPAIMDSLGWAYFKGGRLDQAVVQLRGAFEAEPEGEIAAHLIDALWALGAEPEARELMAQARNQFPDSVPLKVTIERLTAKSP